MPPCLPLSAHATGPRPAAIGVWSISICLPPSRGLRSNRLIISRPTVCDHVLSNSSVDSISLGRDFRSVLQKILSS
jgi:hypothetical protein